MVAIVVVVIREEADFGGFRFLALCPVLASAPYVTAVHLRYPPIRCVTLVRGGG